MKIHHISVLLRLCRAKMTRRPKDLLAKCRGANGRKRPLKSSWVFGDAIHYVLQQDESGWSFEGKRQIGPKEAPADKGGGNYRPTQGASYARRGMHKSSSVRLRIWPGEGKWVLVHVPSECSQMLQPLKSVVLNAHKYLKVLLKGSTFFVTKSLMKAETHPPPLHCLFPKGSMVPFRDGKLSNLF